MKTEAIVVAAGKGRRLKSNTPKPLISLKGKPVLIYALEAFERCPSVRSIVVMAPQNRINDFKNLIRRYRLRKVKSVLAGGRRRSDSVRLGLKALDKDTVYVVVHDAARPFIKVQAIKKVIAAAQKTGGAVLAVPVKSTVKESNGTGLFVKRTLDRRRLWEVQTPQVFKKNTLIKAHSRTQGDPTDDALLVERAGQRIKLVVGDYSNIKITTKEDLKLARMIAAGSSAD